MIRKPYFLLLILGLMIASCSVEKMNLSPLSESVSHSRSSKMGFSLKDIEKTTETNVAQVKYASELSNAIVALPTFENQKLNKAIDALKFNVTEYLYAVREYNENRRAKVLYNLQGVYKKIQKLRKNLSAEQDELLNFYLVKIKTNITLIEASKNASHSQN